MSLNKKWEPEEVAIIHAHIGKITAREIAAMLPGRKYQSVIDYCHKNGIKGGQVGPNNSEGRVWTEEETDLLRELAPKLSLKEVGERLNRKETCIWSRMRRLGIKGRSRAKVYESMRKTISPEILERFKAEIPGISAVEFARKYGLSRQRCQRLAREMGRVWHRPVTVWTPEKDEELRRLAATIPRRDIPAAMGVSISAVDVRMWSLKLRGLRQQTKPRTPKRERAAKKAAAPRPIFVKMRGVYYCHCHAPVPVDSWQGHYERTGHLPPWLEGHGSKAA